MKKHASFVLFLLALASVSFTASANDLPGVVDQIQIGHRCGTLGMRQFVPAPKAIAPVPPRRVGMMPLVGDTRQFWTYDLSVMPPKNKAIQATCRGVGNFVAIWVGDTEWETEVVQADIDNVLASMETTTPLGQDGGVFGNNTTLFGMPPVIMPGDPALTVLIYKIPGYQGNVFDGYFRAEDLAAFNPTCETSPMIYCSNELPMIHVTSDNVGSDYMAGVIAHEFEHLIHYGADAGEEPWLDESLAELAMIHAGYSDPGNLAYFLAHPESSLVIEPPVDYGACLLFGSMLWEWLGDAGIAALVADKANGKASIEAALAPNDVTWSMLFAEFSLANLVDQEVGEWPKDHSLVKVEGLAVTQWGEDFVNKEVTVPATASKYFRITPAMAGKAMYMLFSGSTEIKVSLWNGDLFASDARAWTEDHPLLTEQDMEKGVLYLAFSNPTDTAQTVTFTANVIDAPAVETGPEPMDDIGGEPDAIDYPDLGQADLSNQDGTLEETDTTGLIDGVTDVGSNPGTEPKKDSSGGCSASDRSGNTSAAAMMLMALLAMALVRRKR